MTTAPSVITTATRILRPSGGCRAPAWATGPAASAITTSIMRTRTASIIRIMGHPLKAFCRLLTKDSPAGLCRKDKERTVSASLEAAVPALKRHGDLQRAALVPPVWIEQTTCRLQGGCSTTELRRRRSGLYATAPIFRAHPIRAGVYLDEPHRFGACKSEARCRRS